MTEDEKIAPDGSIADRATGAFVRAVAPCQHPQYDVNGNTVVAGNDGIKPPAHSWIVDGQAATGWMDFISATWTVPPNPGGSGQTLYFFPALLPATEDQLLQPVLGWNIYGNGSTQWSMFSTQCCIVGDTYQSGITAGPTGAQVYGFVWGTECNAETGLCGNWEISIQATGVNPVTVMTTAVEEPMSWSVSATYEEYNITSCAQHPPSESITFSNVTARQVGDIPVSPSWYAEYYGFSPACNINFSSPSSSTATISWCVPTDPCTNQTCGEVLSDGCGGQVTCPACCKPPDIECGCGAGCIPAAECIRICH